MKKKNITKLMNEFVDYVYSFYGEDGIYDMGATRDNITTATIDYISSLSVYNHHQKFCGDSLDRERGRDILTSKFNLKELYNDIQRNNERFI